MVDFDRINSIALSQLENLLRLWLPHGKKQGNEYICGNFNGEKGKSLSINLVTGKGADFASGESVGDVVGIYSKCFNCDRLTAAKELEKILRIDKVQVPLPETLPEEENDEDIKRQEKLNKIISDTVRIKGTPAVKYIKNRGIKSMVKGVLELLGYRRIKENNGALVIFAKDENGNIKSIQQVFINDDGFKSDDYTVKKRTNGFPSGNPIRLPAAPSKENSPILVTEGPEDGLTLSEATGFETWVTCGINFMDKIPLIEGRQYIIVRDNDAPDSEADKRINKVIANLIDKGFKDLLCARPPEGVKDSNDLLKEVGDEAVRDMINSALPVIDCRHIEEEETNEPVDYNENGEPVYMAESSVFEKCAYLPQTDVGNAKRIKERWQNVVKYADGIGWLVYGKGRWNPDLGEYRVINMAALTATEIGREANFVEEHVKDSVRKWAKKSQDGNRISHALRLAKANLAIRGSELDKHPYFLNVANGTVDLKTGKLLNHNSSYLLTKQSYVRYDENAKCPTWERFLKDIFPSNPEIIPFIQRAVGYSLTGDIREQCMFILHGNGSNGKSTFLDTLQGIMSDYWIKTKADAFMEQHRGTDANPFLAMLRGARFVTASETKSDRSLDESIIKESTGDNFITVRSMYQNPITFMPQFKLWLATNHKPEIKGTDEGIWRRLRLIPFKARFYDKNDVDAPKQGPFKDKMLMIKLKSELTGILAWAIKGCLEWQKQGLCPPLSVVDATNEYRKEMDIIGSFFEDCLDICEGINTSCTDVYNTYKEWCSDNGHYALSKNKLGRRIYERGIRKASSKDGSKAYGGIMIKSVTEKNSQGSIWG